MINIISKNILKTISIVTLCVSLSPHYTHTMKRGRDDGEHQAHHQAKIRELQIKRKNLQTDIDEIEANIKATGEEGMSSSYIEEVYGIPLAIKRSKQEEIDREIRRIEREEIAPVEAQAKIRELQIKRKNLQTDIDEIEANIKATGEEGMSSSYIEEVYGIPLAIKRSKQEEIDREIRRIEREEIAPVEAQSKIPLINHAQDLRMFPSEAHASTVLYQTRIKQLDGDITRMDVTFNQPENVVLRNIWALFQSNYSYEERTLVGHALKNTTFETLNTKTTKNTEGTFPTGQEYFWIELTKNQEQIDIMRRFVILNSKTIFYRDLSDIKRQLLLDTAGDDQKTANEQFYIGKDFKFSEELIDCVGLLFESLNEKTGLSEEQSSVATCFNLLSTQMLKAETINQKTRLDLTVNFVIASAQAALDRANALFEQHGLSRI